jgi:hypothetical protein
MRFRFSDPLLILASYLSPPASAQEMAARTGGASRGAVTRVPTGVILVKGAWASASDSETPVPEGGNVTGNVFTDPYFGMTYPLPADWAEKYQGPPPSESGRYVLAELSPTSTFKGSARGSILVTAQDLFFIRAPAINSAELINYMKDNLQADYKVEVAPRRVKIADRSFLLFAYWSPVAQLHWYILTTQIRCHALEIVLTSRDTKLLDALILDLNKMILPAEASPTGGTGGGSAPVCIKDYANNQNVISQVNPVFSEHRYNPVPVRIIIDKDGKVKHIHFLSAFVDQAKAITDALGQWKFKQYMKDGQPIEVETGLLFGPRSTQ